jgi:hypothetical protein
MAHTGGGETVAVGWQGEIWMCDTKGNWEKQSSTGKANFNL